MPIQTAFIADIHGNTPALRAVLDDIAAERCSQVYMLGDLINGLDPHGSAALLQDWSAAAGVPVTCIRGNAEAYLLTPERQNLPRQDEEWNIGIIALVQWFEDHLSAADLDWIRSFPETLQWDDAYLVHDSPLDRLAVKRIADPDILPHQREWFFHGRGIKPGGVDTERQQLLEWMTAGGITQVYCGHTHVPFYQQIDSRLVCNAGSVGMPLDGDPRPAWVLAQSNGVGLPRLEIRRVDYNLDEQLRRIDQTLDYPDFDNPQVRWAFKRWAETGIYWRAHLPPSSPAAA